MLGIKIGISLFSFIVLFLFTYYGIIFLVNRKTKKKSVASKKNIKKRDTKHKNKKYEIFSKVFPGYTYKKYFFLKYGLGFLLYFLLTFSINIVFGLVGFIAGIFVPDLLADYLYKKQLEKFELQLIDGLNLIANALKAGASFIQGVEVMVKEMKDPISKEFNLFLKEVRMGSSIEDALNNLSARIESEELKIAVVSINIARKSGGNLSEILFHISDTIRERERIKRKVSALTSQGKMSGIIIGALPLLLALILYKIDPEMMRPLFNTFMGQLVLLGVLFMELIGFVWIKRIIAIDV